MSPVRVAHFLTLLVPFALSTGCFGAGNSDLEDGAQGDDGALSGAEGDDGGYAEDGGAGGTGGGGDEGGYDDGGGDAGDGGAADDGGDAGVPADGGDDGGTAGTLTAGEWRDLSNWDFWLGLMGPESSWSDMEGEWDFDVTETRVPVVAKAGDDVVADAVVTLVDGQGETVWQGRTDAHGRAELFAWRSSEPTGPFSVRVVQGDNSATVDVADGFEDLADVAAQTVVVELPTAAEPSAAVDLMFVVDTTGSMGDELQFLQVELADVIDTVRAESEQDLDLRLSVNFYRDQNDDYVVRSYPFTADIDEALGQLAGEKAAGGGDFPEAMDEALSDAVFAHQWSADARARLLFLVLDAPPHHEQQRIDAIAEATKEAARLGIRVIPIAGSGMDKDAEFLVRMIDIATGGTYVFLTDDSGVGGTHLEPTVGDYDVELLNNLLVRLVGEAVNVGPAQ